MFQRLADNLKESTGTALRLTSLAAAAALALFITTSFLCAAAFVFMLQRYGLVEACLTGAGVFFVVTVIAAGCYMARKNQVKARTAETAKSAVKTALADPMRAWATGMRMRTEVSERLSRRSEIVCVGTGCPTTPAARSALAARLISILVTLILVTV